MKPDPGHRSPGHVLIVEDDPDARDAMRSYLWYRGVEAEGVGSAQDAIRSSGHRPPAVVICDWQLGGQADGVSAAAAIQRRCGARVIFVTAHRLSELQRRTSKLSVTAFLRKPVALSELADLVAAELER